MPQFYKSVLKVSTLHKSYTFKKAKNEEPRRIKHKWGKKRLNSNISIIIKLKLGSFEISTAKAIQRLCKG